MVVKSPEMPPVTESVQEGRDSVRAQVSAPDPSHIFGEYVGGGANDVRVQANIPTIEDITGPVKRAWNDKVQGRVAIRAFSRGILGAAFFAWGNLRISQDLNNYDRSLSLAQQKGLLQMMSKIFDTVLGTPIEATLNQVQDGLGTRAITFRPTRSERYLSGGSNGEAPNPTIPYTLGKEMVSRTFDFAMASIGDATGRGIAAIFDPNVEKKWMKDGRIDLPKAAKSLAHSTWTIMTKAQGEDWFVALPYVYFLRFQRNLIDKFSPGFGYDSDRGLNGGSFKIKDGNVAGNYGIEGALDLEGRFIGYNIGTLMYREGYEAVGRHLNEFKKKGYKADITIQTHPVEIAKSAARRTKQFLRYWLKSIIKGTVFMTPAVVGFWAFRTPQTRYKGIAIDPERGVAYYDTGFVASYGEDRQIPIGDTLQERYLQSLQSVREYPGKDFEDNPIGYHFDANVGNLNSGFVGPDVWFGTSHLYYRKIENNKPVEGSENHLTADPLERNPFHAGFDPFRTEYYGSKVRYAFDTILNPVGRAIYTSGEKFAAFTPKISRRFGVDDAFAADFSRRFVDAATSYYPYMWLKAETQRKWDRHSIHPEERLMDDSIYKMIDGLFTFKGSLLKEGASGFKQALFERHSGKKAEARRAARKAEAAQAEILARNYSIPLEKAPATMAASTPPQTLAERQVAQIMEEHPLPDAPEESQKASFAQRFKSSEWQTIRPTIAASHQQRVEASKAGSVPPGTTIH